MYLYHKQHRAGIEKFPGDSDFNEVSISQKNISYF
jgi:hypothetical protein